MSENDASNGCISNSVIHSVIDKAYDSDTSAYEYSPAPWVADDAIERSSNIFNQVSLYLNILTKSNYLYLYSWMQ